MTEKAYEKHAWILLFILGIVGLIFSLTDLLYSFGLWGILADPQEVTRTAGMTLEEISASFPRIGNYIRGQLIFGGLYLFAVSVLEMVIVAVPFRREERWAWYVSWLVPTLLIAVVINNLRLGGSLWPLLMLFLIVSLLGLILPIRKYFPKKQT